MEKFEALGYNIDLAEAFSEYECSPEDIKQLSIEDALDKLLEWNGISGYTRMVMKAIKNLTDLGHK